MAFTHTIAVYNPFCFLGSTENNGDLTFISGWFTRYFCISEELLSLGCNRQCKLYVTGRFLHPTFSEHMGRSSAGVNQCRYAQLLQLRIWHICLTALPILKTHILFLCELKCLYEVLRTILLFWYRLVSPKETGVSKMVAAFGLYSDPSFCVPSNRCLHHCFNDVKRAWKKIHVWERNWWKIKSCLQMRYKVLNVVDASRAKYVQLSYMGAILELKSRLFTFLNPMCQSSLHWNISITIETMDLWSLTSEDKLATYIWEVILLPKIIPQNYL